MNRASRRFLIFAAHVVVCDFFLTGDSVATSCLFTNLYQWRNSLFECNSYLIQYSRSLYSSPDVRTKYTCYILLGNSSWNLFVTFVLQKCFSKSLFYSSQEAAILAINVTCKPAPDWFNFGPQILWALGRNSEPWSRAAYALALYKESRFVVWINLPSALELTTSNKRYNSLKPEWSNRPCLIRPR